MHLAAQASVSRSVGGPLFDASVDLLGTISLLTACRCRGVVYTLTGSAAYGEADVLPTPEQRPMNPRVKSYGGWITLEVRLLFDV